MKVWSSFLSEPEEVDDRINEMAQSGWDVFSSNSHSSRYDTGDHTETETFIYVLLYKEKP